MKPTVSKWLLALGAAMTLSACGGGSDDGYDVDHNTPGATQPRAVIQASVDDVAVGPGNNGVAVGRTIRLEAGASAGGVIGYQWILTKKPASSQAVLQNASSVSARFVPDVPGDYAISLSVSNGSASAATVLEVVAVSQDPVAVTAGEVEALVGPVQLDGSASVPPADGDKAGLSYFWQITSVPPESGVKRFDENEASRALTRFTADVPGKYEAELTVIYQGRSSAPTPVVIRVVKAYERPIATVAPLAEPLVRGQTIRLDGTPSTSGSGGALQYRWEITGTPEGLIGTDAAPIIQDADKAVLLFTPRSAGTYYATLSVFDGVSVNQNYMQRSLRVVAPADVVKTAPVARINLQLYSPSAEVEQGRLELNGRDSYDIDVDGNYHLNYEWTLLEAPAGFSLEATPHELRARYSYVTTTHFGQYRFRFRVQDATGLWSAPVEQTYTVMNGANRAPQALAASANASTTVGVGGTVRLDGSGSSDPDANRLTYAWTLAQRPDGSQAVLSASNSVSPSFVADVAGPYRADLVVTDSHGVRSVTSQLKIFAKAQNHKPQVRPSQGGQLYTNQGRIIYDQDQPLLIGKHQIGRTYQAYLPGGVTKTYTTDHWNSFVMAANAYDPDGDPLNYLWTLAAAPANSLEKATTWCSVGGNWTYATKGDYDAWLDSLAKLGSWDCAALSVAPTVTGTYEVELLVSDGVERVGPFRLSLQAATRDQYPSLLLEDLLQGAGQQSYDPMDNPGFVSSGVEITPRQYIFPLAYKQQSNFPLWGHQVELGGETQIKTYRLTASKGDYTIADLAATSVHTGFGARFIGLKDGQVIRQGETVEFQLAFTAPLELPEAGQPLREASDGLNWFFRIKERPDWTFQYTPYIF